MCIFMEDNGICDLSIYIIFWGFCLMSFLFTFFPSQFLSAERRHISKSCRWQHINSQRSHLLRFLGSHWMVPFIKLIPKDYLKRIFDRLIAAIFHCDVGADQWFGRGGGQQFFFRELPTARNAEVWSKWACIGQGPGPALGPWKPLYF